MPQEHGIKETREVIDAALEIAVVAIELSKDGIDVSDAVALATNPKIQEKLVKAGKGISKVPDEVKDLDVDEGFLLAADAMVGVKRIIKALKDKKAA